MNTVLDLQKLAHDTDGKGQAVDATPTTVTVTTVTTTVAGWSTQSQHHC
ncbi:class III lanthipeptide [Paenibacillus thiaminolyticus]|nr:class III lanthipeptide [Paenibacillus dendritiformis]